MAKAKTSRKSRKSRKSRESRKSRNSRKVAACKARCSRRPSAYLKFVKAEFNKHYKGGGMAGSRKAMKAVAAAWRVKQGR
jgi:hypothetical protein